MNAIFDDLSAELGHVADWFHRPGDTITDNNPDQQEGTDNMPLADTAASLKDTHAGLTASLQTAGASVAEALDNHAARLGQLVGDVEAVAAIAGHPLMQAAEGVLHVDPAVLQGFITGLNALAQAFPKPADQPEPQPA